MGRKLKNVAFNTGDSLGSVVVKRSSESAGPVKKDIAPTQDAVLRAKAAATSRNHKASASAGKAPPDTIMSNHQVALLQQANAHLVIAAIEAQKMAEAVQAAKVQLDYLAHHDPLTDLPNRILLQDRLNQSIEMARRQGRQLAVMFMDLDQFKNINDSLGHAVGDQLLQSVAQRLVGCVRQSDTISRQGGDEFVLLLPDLEHAEHAARSAQKILDVVAQPYCIDQHDLYTSVSIGIGIYPNDGEDAQDLIKSADTAMYFAKATGRNNYKFFEQSMNVRAVNRQSTEASLRRALARNDFLLHYQPKINLRNGTIVGVEALVRWQHPERGLLLPAEFIAIAEDCGLIIALGRWVLRAACLQARAWQLAGLPPVTVAVNTSALEFRAKGFIENIHAILAETGFDAHYLEIELTESVLMRDVDSTGTVLRALADAGIKLTVDDFGTGYSSLSYLRKFPIDTLKIDQSFVKEMTRDPDDATIVRAVISMGKSLKQRVIAEGVGTPEQYTALLTEGCEEGQGPYSSRPLPAEEFAELLRNGISEKVLNVPEIFSEFHLPIG